MPINFEKAAAIASKYINSTNCPIFLTGRAGTGKTTFLKEVVKTSHKNTIVAAPTGIAAINAEGVTLHSLFQLPFGCFVPSNQILSSDTISTQVTTPRTLMRDLQLNATKRKMLQELELLIIDEVSMLRADLLDAIDYLLRTIRRKRNAIFGGVQILFIGDLYQLPPVVKDDEWKFLSPHYSSIHFFEAKALQNSHLKYIELNKIYRQTDERFISILNRLRDNKTTKEDIEVLNKYYNPNFKSDNNEGYITLTTHNWKADELNRDALNKLPGNIFLYDAEIKGDFNENIFPIEYTLKLKEGAQVMFIKNDHTGQQRYFNGKIGKITSINDEEIIVSFDDGTPPTTVDLYTWENKRYSLNKNTNEIEEKIIGEFIHYPIKLAWAITVHKSQGLTFSKAIIDVSRAFAPGQVYVALSRLESLDGLVLTSRIPTSGLEQEDSIRLFAESKPEEKTLEKEFNNESVEYISEVVRNAFNFNWLESSLVYHIESYDKDLARSAKQQYKSWAENLHKEFAPIRDIADKFLSQAERILNSGKNNLLLSLHERVTAAKGYFEPLLKNHSKKIIEHIDDLRGTRGIKKYTNELSDLELLFFKQLQIIYKSEALIRSSLENIELTKQEMIDTGLYTNREIISTKISEKKTKSGKKEKKEKVDTKALSFKLHKEGKTIAEIANERSLAVSTIEGHLAHYVGLGELNPDQFIDKVKLKAINKKINEIDERSLTAIKNSLDFETTYGELRFAIAWHNYQQSKQSSQD